MLCRLMAALADDIKRRTPSSGAWVLLEGPMGAGKSTAARELISALGANAPSEGSPTFPLIHEYETANHQTLLHLDLYRLHEWEDAVSAGIPSCFWERPGAIVICEWTSRFPQLLEELLRDSSTPLWQLALAHPDPESGKPETRSLRIFKR
jgi:tRNA threonylcarbamoyl adenosine modification protein YjeE